MNPIGIHFGYWTQYWSSDPLDFVARAKKCGFDVLEVNALKVTLMSNAEPDKLKGAAAEAGLTLTYSIGMTADMDLVSEDATVRKKGIGFLQDVSKAMKYMGGRVMTGINYSSWPRKLLPAEDKRVLTDRAIAGVKEAIKAAEDNDVLFCVEVVNRFEQFMMNTAEEGVAFAERVGSPNCKVLLDTFHYDLRSLRKSGDRSSLCNLRELATLRLAGLCPIKQDSTSLLRFNDQKFGTLGTDVLRISRGNPLISYHDIKVFD